MNSQKLMKSQKLGAAFPCQCSAWIMQAFGWPSKHNPLIVSVLMQSNLLCYSQVAIVLASPYQIEKVLKIQGAKYKACVKLCQLASNNALLPVLCSSWSHTTGTSCGFKKLSFSHKTGTSCGFKKLLQTIVVRHKHSHCHNASILSNCGWGLRHCTLENYWFNEPPMQKLICPANYSMV